MTRGPSVLLILVKEVGLPSEQMSLKGYNYWDNQNVVLTLMQRLDGKTVRLKAESKLGDHSSWGQKSKHTD